MPIGKIGQSFFRYVEFAAVVGLILFLASEIIPYTSLKGNGVVEAILNALMKAFPRPEKPE